MNPRYRRLLIPGLLVVLIVVVLMTSLAREARGVAAVRAAADAQIVSTMSDSSIVESSGLVISVKNEDLAYTVNDSGNDSIVFAIRISTGDVVGTSDFGESFDDAEALSIDSTGTLWIADTGDNDQERDDVRLYAIDEPGEGDHSASPKSYRLTYPDGPQNVEALLINPRTNEKFVVSKAVSGGVIYALPERLSEAEDNQVKAVGKAAPLITDGAFTPDGKHALLRDLGTVRAYDAETWEQTSIAELPKQEQGETLAMEASGDTILVGSEGENSQLFRVRFSVVGDPNATPPSAPSNDDGSSAMGTFWLIGAFVIVAGVCIVVVRRRR